MGYRFGFVRTRGRSLPLAFAGFAPFGFVSEIFVVEEVLFSRCKYELRSAIHALEDAILKLRHSEMCPAPT
jgi:hypothetical protein